MTLEPLWPGIWCSSRHLRFKSGSDQVPFSSLPTLPVLVSWVVSCPLKQGKRWRYC